MRTISLEGDAVVSDFTSCKTLGDSVASALLGPAVCLSWFDRAQNRESPAHASECHGTCEVPGYVEYAQHRGGALRVVCGEGDFVFCYRPLGEFADEPSG
jgi:hypothetical protein